MFCVNTLGLLGIGNQIHEIMRGSYPMDKANGGEIVHSLSHAPGHLQQTLIS